MAAISIALLFSLPDFSVFFDGLLDPKRTESASFLIWYLENYLRLDTVEAVDSICDQSGDTSNCTVVSAL